MADVEKKRILILTADAGFGHRSAANAIEAALGETHGADCAVDLVNPLDDSRVLPVLRNSGSDYDRLVRDMPDLYKIGYEISDALVPTAMLEGALIVMLYEVLGDVIDRLKPDAIVTTYPLYQSPLGALSVIRRQHVPLITVVTDLATVHHIWFNDAADECLVATPTVCDLALASGLEADRVHITGIPVHPRAIRETRTPAAIRHALGWSDRADVKTVLAVGSKRVGNLLGVVRALNHSGLPLQLAVVAGGDDELYDQLQSEEWHVPAHVYNFVDNMPELMHASDCIICKAGGLIVTESLACGLPLLLVDVVPGQETGNADYVVQAGAGELSPTPLDGLETLCHWLLGGGVVLAQRAENARRLGKPRAAYDVTDRAWAAAQAGSGTASRLRPLHRSRLVALLRRFQVPKVE